MSGSNEKRVFLDMGIDGQLIGRIEIRLFVNDAPKTCENFRALCTGEVGMAPNNKARLHYRGNEFHRIVKKFMIQGGDITEGDGRGGYSIYGRYFDDEKFRLKHSKPYLLSMANKGPNSNSSQFFITTAPAPHCNEKHVVFGEVVRGKEVVDAIENLEVDSKSKPLVSVVIANCGELVKKKKMEKSAEELAALEEEKRKEDAKNKIPEAPKSWLYRNDENDENSKRKRRKSRSRSRSKLRNRSRGQKDRERRDRGDHREGRGDRGDRKDDSGIRVRGRGSIQFQRRRSKTPEHWRINAPIKWEDYKK